MSFYDMVPLGFGADALLPSPQQGPESVEFILRYKGRLQADHLPDKLTLRQAVSTQLEQLCKRHEFFRPCLRTDLLVGEWRNNKLNFEHDDASPANGVAFCRVPLGGFEFVPLIHRQFYLACQLDVTWLRKDFESGILVGNGDLDNKLKTVFDGLRMPHTEEELGGVTPISENQRLYCLLDDDSLITKLSISTHKLLEPVDVTSTDDKRGNLVELLMKVTVLTTSRRVGNMGVGPLI